MKKKLLLSVVLAGSLAFATGCAGNTEAEPAPSESAASAPAEAPTPDLEGVPEVVATVNGTEITKEEFTTSYEGAFQQMSMQSQVTGQEVDQEQLKTQTLDNLIGNKLLIQEADNRGIEASEEAVTATTDELVASNQFASADELFAALEEEQGITKEDATSQIEQQVRLDALLAEESGDTAPTEEELKAAYEEAKASGAAAQGGEIPPYEEVKPQLEQQVKDQKKSEAALALVEKLRGEADVVSNL
ncbi:SurA N-terminal domain-containing protein [uncultured Arthrobacter sp.]|uniref:SurA N-terminal domain-containing protein n=1 Tax=uncultured Arthrobacter sp. TaxID=114050 RepID=UPI00263361CB|nr:SurA N-terminal domain-containing protein [uncultured Arthrobacter sp.]